MTVALSNTTYPISPGFSKETIVRTKTNGDDRYRDAASDGINTELETWTINWVPMYYTTAVALEALLKNSTRGKDNYLAWTPPGESTLKYYSAEGISRRIVGPRFLQISATMKRRFITG